MQRTAEVAETAKALADVQAVTARREWAEQSATMNRAFHVRSAIKMYTRRFYVRLMYYSSWGFDIVFIYIGQASGEVALMFDLSLSRDHTK